MNISKEKLEAFDKAVLLSGKHKDFETGVCAMELVSYIADEPFSDAPKCACPALTSYVVSLNDNLEEDERQLLKPYLLELLGTRDGKESQRAHLMAYASITVFAPFALDNAGLKSEADKMRAVKFGDWSAAYAASSAAKSAAESAAESAAYSAASSAASSAAESAAWSVSYAAYAASSASSSAAYAAYAAYAASYGAEKKDRSFIIQEALNTLQKAIKV